MATHPASTKFPPVAALSWIDLEEIILAAPGSRLSWSSREKSAWQELQKRSIYNAGATSEDVRAALNA